MATDEESVLRAARRASEVGGKHIGRAEEQLRTARREFVGSVTRGTVGAVSFEEVGRHLGRRRDDVGDAYRDVASALDAAEKAVKSAREACARLAKLARG